MANLDNPFDRLLSVAVSDIVPPMNVWFRFTIAALLLLATGLNGLGQGLDPKTKAALEAVHKKANEGDAESQFLLGAYFDTGKMGLRVMPDQAAIWYRKSAGQGYAMAQNALGSLYNSDKLGAPDFGQAMQWFRTAADQDLSLAEYNLGYMYYAGRGTRQNHREALRWFGKAASKGFDIAQFTVGKMLETGAGLVNENLPEAFRWFELAAHQNHGPSQYKLAIMYLRAQGVPQDYVKACKWMILAAAQKAPRANEVLREIIQLPTTQQAEEAETGASQFLLRPPSASTAPEPNLDALAPLLTSGRRPLERAIIPHMTPDVLTPRTPQVPSVADVSMADRSAPAAPAASSLPTMPRTTVSGATPPPAPAPAPAVTPTRSMPTTMLPTTTAAVSTPAPSVSGETTMARSMVAPALAPSAPSVAPGSLPPVSEYAPVELVRLKYEAVEEGDAESRFQLGRVFARGDRVNQNFTEALKWHTLAAQQGHSGAQAALGTMHYWGRGASQDYARAARWLLLSAEQGNSTAQFWLGMIYDRGDPKERLKWFREAAEHGSTLGQTYVAGLLLAGTAGESDTIEAYKWLELAANQGSKNAKDMRATLGDLLSEKEIAAAKARALQFIPKRRMAPLGR
jgi:TPR repeat protein